MYDKRKALGRVDAAVTWFDPRGPEPALGGRTERAFVPIKGSIRRIACRIPACTDVDRRYHGQGVSRYTSRTGHPIRIRGIRKSGWYQRENNESGSRYT